jgi:hypothetical protein
MPRELFPQVHLCVYRLVYQVSGSEELFNQRQRHAQLAELAVLDRTGYLTTMLTISGVRMMSG